MFSSDLNVAPHTQFSLAVAKRFIGKTS